MYDSPSKNNDFFRGFYSGFTVIFITGLGDKVFFLNMIYSSINSFFKAFAVVFVITELMNLINILIGETLQILIGINIIEWAAIIIFLVLGICLIIRGFQIENKVLEQEYENDGKNYQSKLTPSQSQEVRISNRIKEGSNNEEIGVFDSWWKYFLLYVIGSLLDKSQIATILITSKYNFTGLWIGSSLAQLCLILCSMLLGKGISKLLTNRQISFICGILFFVFGILFTIDKFVFKIY